MPELKDYPYLKDVAKLEWALHISYFASDAEPIDRDKLSQIPQEHLGDVKFKLHPSYHLISSKFPIDKIWEISQDGYDGDTNIRTTEVIITNIDEFPQVKELIDPCFFWHM
ncbi:MAG: hypothetical protein EB075_06660 [Bacteroidetes bacterium]|nr:hypothetical protein [Bacteroidota bacterium]